MIPLVLSRVTGLDEMFPPQTASSPSSDSSFRFGCSSILRSVFGSNLQQSVRGTQIGCLPQVAASRQIKAPTNAHTSP
jgi:hypothetical protein